MKILFHFVALPICVIVDEKCASVSLLLLQKGVLIKLFDCFCGRGERFVVEVDGNDDDVDNGFTVVLFVDCEDEEELNQSKFRLLLLRHKSSIIGGSLVVVLVAVVASIEKVTSLFEMIVLSLVAFADDDDDVGDIVRFVKFLMFSLYRD